MTPQEKQQLKLRIECLEEQLKFIKNAIEQPEEQPFVYKYFQSLYEMIENLRLAHNKILFKDKS